MHFVSENGQIFVVCKKHKMYFWLNEVCVVHV